MPLERSVLQKYREAGKIARTLRESVLKTVEEGMAVMDVCEWVENEIRRLGGHPAFPCNVSINHVAAHYTSPPNDEMLIPERSLVKVDIGVHIDGYIADTAVTLCFNSELGPLVETAEQALSNGIKAIRPDISTSDFGSMIQRFIESRGFKPISNLTGHQVDRDMIHTGKTLPNVAHFSTTRIKEGEVFAIEPFVTTAEGGGRVRDGPPGNIYRLIKQKTVKNPNANKVLNYIKTHYRTLPFAERWLRRAFSKETVDKGIPSLLESKNLMVYPTLIEVNGKPVAQAEHTVLITDKGCEVLT
ncbi:MAG: type II methionyl aminopeptidase [Candidatus Bathyarchaeia archaeon]